MLLLCNQNKDSMIILDNLTAVIEYSRDIVTDKSHIGLNVIVDGQRISICEIQYNKNDMSQINKVADQLRCLKVDIIEAYRTYKDNVISNPFQDEYYYIDYNYKLIKVYSAKEVF